MVVNGTVGFFFFVIQDEDGDAGSAVDVTEMESVSTLPTPAVPQPGKEGVTKSEGASSEQKGKPLATTLLYCKHDFLLCKSTKRNIDNRYV